MAVFTRFSGGFCILRVCVAPAAPPPLWAVPGPPGHEKRTPTAADAHDLKIVVKLRAVPASKVPFPVEIAGFPDFSRPVPVYPAFLKYVVPVQTLRILREEYGFRGYIHAKAIPGADDRLLNRLGHLADRMSVNIELPSQKSLERLAPDKTKSSITRPMALLRDGIRENSTNLIRYKSAEPFVPAGQSTQMIVGATPESDYQILTLSAALYKKFAMKRVFYSAYIPLADNPLLPAVTTKPPLLREHRLYQADWLLRFYGFEANEILDENHQTLNPLIDPKCNWAINHMELFPVEVNTAPREMLLRVPGMGVNSVIKILRARREGRLDFEGLRRIGVVLKRARYFITCSGKMMDGVKMNPDNILRALITPQGVGFLPEQGEQLSLFPDRLPFEEVAKCITGQI